MKHSFIFCYRDREEHLKRTIPRLKSHMELMGIDHEIIIVEQDDNKKFRRANLLNEGAKYAEGDILIFHDIDYYPLQDVVYYDGVSDVHLPVKRVRFVNSLLADKPLEDVPSGYRHFKDGVDDNFFGAVEVFKRDGFFKINGFSTKFVGWGCEDADLRERVYHYGLSVTRGNGSFLALDHVDNGPPPTDPDFNSNIVKAANWMQYLNHGVNNQPSKSSIVPNSLRGVDKWVKATEFDGPQFIVASKF